MKRSKRAFPYGIVALIISGAILLAQNGPLGLSVSKAADILQNIADEPRVAQISPEIKELLQGNNLRVAQYQSPAPDFTLHDLDGNVVRLSQFRGETVLLGFFTTW